MKRISAVSTGKAVFLLAMTALMAVGIVWAAQSYFSYAEVTAAADRCYDLGGFPEIEKNGWQMTRFECHID